jgi:hypothetical protein
MVLCTVFTVFSQNKRHGVSFSTTPRVRNLFQKKTEQISRIFPSKNFAFQLRKERETGERKISSKKSFFSQFEEKGFCQIL